MYHEQKKYQKNKTTNKSLKQPKQTKHCTTTKKQHIYKT